MKAILEAVVGALFAALRPRAILFAENLVLRQRRHFADLVEEHGEKYAVGCQCGWRGRNEDLKKEKREAIVLRCAMCSSDDVYLVLDEALAGC